MYEQVTSSSPVLSPLIVTAALSVFASDRILFPDAADTHSSPFAGRYACLNVVVLPAFTYISVVAGTALTVIFSAAVLLFLSLPAAMQKPSFFPVILPFDAIDTKLLSSASSYDGASRYFQPALDRLNMLLFIAGL